MNYASVINDVKQNLKCSRDRRGQAARNIAFWQHGCDMVTRFSTDNPDNRERRLSWLMRQVVAILSRDLYRQSPLRIVPDDEAATEWLAQIYKQNAIWAKMPEADRLSTVADVAWFQVAATGNPHDPLRINLFGSDQIEAYARDDDPTKAFAVVVISQDDGPGETIIVRYTVWTEELIEVYEARGTGTAKPGLDDTPKIVSSEPNPYQVIPFSSVHYEYPTTGLWTNSPGTYLYKVNRNLNWRLSRINDMIQDNPPMKVVENADANFQPPTPFTSKDFLQIPGATATKDGKFRYEQANLGFVKEEWADLEAYIEHTLECVGVPPAAYRQIESSAKSGAAMMAEQISLVETAISRQMPFSHYEEQLARKCFMVYQAYYGKALVDLDDFSLTVKYPNFYPDLPGPERDRADQWDLDNDLISLIGLLQKRDHLTEEEAIAHLEKVAENKKEQERILGVEPAPVTVMGGDGMSPGDLPYGGQQETNEE